MRATMRSLLLPLILCAAVSGYEVGKEYLYQYEGNIRVTQRDAPTRYVGLAFRSKVLVQPRDHHTHFKVLDFETATVHTEDVDIETDDFTYHRPRGLADHVENAFAAKFTGGKFENVKLDKNDTLLSRNIRRAVVGLFQVGLAPARSFSLHATEYKVLEDSINGMCETQYIISEGANDGHESLFEVTKVVNFRNCTNPRTAFYGSFRGHKCESCESQDKYPLIMSAAVQYQLRGTPENFVIDKAVSTASKAYNPFNEGIVLLILENRTLKFLREQEAVTDTTTPANLEVYTSLGEELPMSTSLIDVEDLKRRNDFIATFDTPGDKDKFRGGFQELLDLDFKEDDYKDVTKNEGPAQKFLEIYHIFLTYEYDDIDDFHKFILANAEEEKNETAMSLFLDLLSAVGTNQHLAYGLKLIEEAQLTTEQARRFLNRLPFNVLEPSDAVLHAIINICKTGFVKADERLEGTCLLAATSIIETGCKRAKSDEESDGGLCKAEIVERFYNYSATPQDVRNESDYICGIDLEIGGKLATRRAVLKLATYASPQVRYPMRRESALWALVQAAPKQPHLVRHILLPMYMNTSESHPTRIAAFVGLISTNPDLYLLHHIARRIIVDPSDQLASYVTSFFREMAKANYPCYSALARKLKHVVTLWNHVERFARKPERTRSRFGMSSTYDERYNYGGTTELSVIMSEDSYLPQSIRYAVKDYFAGFNFDTLSITYQGWGVDRLLSGLVAPRPGSVRNMWDFFGNRRVPREAEETRRPDYTLHITPRGFETFVGNMKINIFGHTVETLQFDEKLLDAIKGTSTSGESLMGHVMSLLERDRKTKHFYVTPVLVWQFPTDSGLPAFLEIRQTNFFYLNRQQATFQHEDDEFHLAFQRHYLYDTFSYTYFGFGLLSEQSYLGAGYTKRLSVSLPLNLRATYDLKNHRMRLQRPLSLPVDLVKYSFKSLATVGTYNGSHYTEYFSTPLYNQELAQHNEEYLTDFLGFGFNVTSHFLGKDLNNSLNHFWHDMDLRQKIYYLDTNPHWHPRYLSVQVVPAKEYATHTIELDIGYKFHGPNDVDHSRTIVELEGTPGNTTSHVLNVELLYKGDNRTRSIRTELQVAHTRDLLKHWVRFYYDRSPFYEGEENHSQVCLSTAATFPRTDWSRIDNITTFYRGYTVKAKADLAYGYDCSNGSRVSLRGSYEHTDADAEEMDDLAHDGPSTRNRFKHSILRKLFNKCSMYQDRGIKLNHFCVEYLYHSSRLGKLNLDVEYSDFKPIRPLHLSGSRHHSKKHSCFLGTVLSHFNGTEGRLHVVSQVPEGHAESRHTASVVVTTPDGHVFHHDHVPTYTHLLEPRVFKMVSYTNLQEYSTSYEHEMCDLQAQTVRTFDGVVVRLPDTDCYKVLARDCSPSNRFVVLAKATNISALSKVLKVFMRETVIDVFPSTETAGAVVRVNDQTVPLSRDHPYSHVTDGAELFYVRTGRNSLHINSDSHGFYVFFNTDALFVQAAPIHRGKLCGLCGDYNYDRHKELRGPDKRLYDDDLEFAKSYVIHSDDCHQG